MTDHTNTPPIPYQSGRLEPCPFCGRTVKYNDQKWAFAYDMWITHNYDTTKLYTTCPMRFSNSFKWKRYNEDGDIEEIMDDEAIQKMKEKFIHQWNSRTYDLDELTIKIGLTKEELKEEIKDVLERVKK